MNNFKEVDDSLLAIDTAFTDMSLLRVSLEILVNTDTNDVIALEMANTSLSTIVEYGPATVDAETSSKSSESSEKKTIIQKLIDGIVKIWNSIVATIKKVLDFLLQAISGKKEITYDAIKTHSKYTKDRSSVTLPGKATSINGEASAESIDIVNSSLSSARLAFTHLKNTFILHGVLNKITLRVNGLVQKNINHFLSMGYTTETT